MRRQAKRGRLSFQENLPPEDAVLSDTVPREDVDRPPLRELQQRPANMPLFLARRKSGKTHKFYCMKCRASRQARVLSVSRTKRRGVSLLRGRCPRCGSKMCTFRGNR